MAGDMAYIYMCIGNNYNHNAWVVAALQQQKQLVHYNSINVCECAAAASVAQPHACTHTHTLAHIRKCATRCNLWAPGFMLLLLLLPSSLPLPSCLLVLLLFISYLPFVYLCLGSLPSAFTCSHLLLYSLFYIYLYFYCYYCNIHLYLYCCCC